MFTKEYIATERQRLQDALIVLQRQFTAEMRGRMVPTLKAHMISKKIDETKDSITALDNETARQLAISKLPTDSALEIIALPLLADVVYDIVIGVNSTLKKAGVEETVFGNYARQIRTAARSIMETLENADEGLPKLIEVDDTLVDAVKKK